MNYIAPIQVKMTEKMRKEHYIEENEEEKEMNIQEILKGDFQFKQWSSHKNAPKEFENDLSKFGTFTVYETFADFLEDNDHFLESETGEPIELDVILDNAKHFNDFLETKMQIADGEGPNINELHQPIVYGVIDDNPSGY